MGWDQGRYYSRSKRVNGRVVREYVGGGELGQLAAEFDALKREEREAERAAERARRATIAERDAPLDDLDELATQKAEAALVATGHHKHNYCVWRRKRRMNVNGEETRSLIKRARSGDETTVEQVRELLLVPVVIEKMGNLARRAEMAYIWPIAGDDIIEREAIKAKLDEMRKELHGENPTPIERLLVERVVACWLQVKDADYLVASQKDGMQVHQADYNQRRQDSAHKRYLNAIKALAVVRKLAVPFLQHNLTPGNRTPTTPKRRRRFRPCEVSRLVARPE
ncbi:MAG: hypothetical protein K8U57_03505 [Planctomycetes bacterium]|nr:hypothetical protein [Planctomycetota bacterium]